MLGETLDRFHVGEFVVSRTRYGASSQLAPHAHDTGYLSIVLTGAYTEAHRNGGRLCQPFTALLHPRGELHADHFHTSTECLNIELYGRDTVDVALAITDVTVRSWTQRFLQHRSEGARNTASAIESLLRRLERQTCADAATCAVPRDLAQPQARTTAVGIARNLGVHRAHVSRLFKAAYGAAPREFRVAARVQRATKFLVKTRLPLAQIALTCDFFDQAHFTKQFRDRIGMTPNAYRRTFFAIACAPDQVHCAPRAAR